MGFISFTAGNNGFVTRFLIKTTNKAVKSCEYLYGRSSLMEIIEKEDYDEAQEMMVEKNVSEAWINLKKKTKFLVCPKAQNGSSLLKTLRTAFSKQPLSKLPLTFQQWNLCSCQFRCIKLRRISHQLRFEDTNCNESLYALCHSKSQS